MSPIDHLQKAIKSLRYAKELMEFSLHRGETPQEDYETYCKEIDPLIAEYQRAIKILDFFQAESNKSVNEILKMKP